MNEEQVNYVKEQFAAGYGADQVRSVLIGHGYSETLADALITAAQAGATEGTTSGPVAQPESTPAEEVQESTAGFTGMQQAQEVADADMVQPAADEYMQQTTPQETTAAAVAVTPEQQAYVDGQRTAGVPEETIRAALEGAGYTPDLVNALVPMISTPAEGAEAQQAQAVPQGQRSLPPIGYLIKEPLVYMFHNPGLVAQYIGFSFLLILVVVGLPMLGVLGVFNAVNLDVGALGVMVVGFFVIAMIAGFVGGIFMQALYYAVSAPQPVSFMKGLGWTFRHFFSLVWVILLVTVVIWGGSMLLVVPGIIVMVYTLFAAPVIMHENVRGLGALMRSRELVYGFWWGVFGRMLLLMLMSFILMLPLIIVLSVVTAITPYASLVIQPLITAVVTIYMFRGFGLIYHYLSGGAPAYNAAAVHPRGKYITLAFLGLLFPLLWIGVIAASTLLSLDGARDNAMMAADKSMLNSQRAEAEIYYFDQGNSYAGYCASETAQEASFVLNQFDCDASESTYRMSAALGGGAYYCVDSSGQAIELTYMPSGLSCN